MARRGRKWELDLMGAHATRFPMPEKAGGWGNLALIIGLLTILILLVLIVRIL